MKHGNTFFVIGFFISFASLFIYCNAPEEKGGEWQAPSEADKLHNPFQNNLAAEEKGKGIYNLYCATCHGTYGFGDGAAGLNSVCHSGEQRVCFHLFYFAACEIEFNIYFSI